VELKFLVGALAKFREYQAGITSPDRKHSHPDHAGQDDQVNVFAEPARGNFLDGNSMEAAKAVVMLGFVHELSWFLNAASPVARVDFLPRR
jgi:hypothetical protein